MDFADCGIKYCEHGVFFMYINYILHCKKSLVDKGIEIRKTILHI